MEMRLQYRMHEKQMPRSLSRPQDGTRSAFSTNCTAVPKKR
jgi:hypothetical protein